jgi:hypothetical protein
MKRNRYTYLHYYITSHCQQVLQKNISFVLPALPYEMCNAHEVVMHIESTGYGCDIIEATLLGEKIG